jgi:2-oxoglutarate dehydrogenase E1 component
MGVLGFDYGYSMECPEGLVIWEAQFGDFCNSAQVMVDQFIAAGEDKWKRLSGLVLFLPHGFEGQGPEHSSARLERFLQLAAEDNIQVVQPTTPAQLFHLLRRQVLRSWRKPLIVMTPKSLLRHPRVTSSLEELAEGRFAPVLPDGEMEAKAVKRILMCSGKVYYDLLERREREKARNVAILRLEQLYPLRREELHRILADYNAGAPLVWVQEEPENMGAWRFLRHHLAGELPGGRPFTGISREASAGPATGSGNRHRQEQENLLARAFART